MLTPCALAADTAIAPGTATLAFERTGGAIADVLGQLFKLLTFTDESRIKKASPRDVVQTIAKQRAAQGFTVWQSEPNGDFGADYDLTDGVTQKDIYGLKELDARYAIVAESGLVHAKAEFFFPPSMNALIAAHGGYSAETVSGLVSGRKKTTFAVSDEAKAYLERLSLYWVARFGAYPVIWTLGQEVDNDFYDAEYNKGEWNSLNHPYKWSPIPSQNTTSCTQRHQSSALSCSVMPRSCFICSTMVL